MNPKFQMIKYPVFALLLMSLYFLISCNNVNSNKEKSEITFDVKDVKAIKNPRNVSQKWHADTTKKIIKLDELTALLKKNAISPVNDPVFITNSAAKKTLFQGQPVIAVEISGQSKCYPLNVLSYHEIVNDTLGGMQITVAYCPLCNTASVFNRELKFNNKKYTLKFGTSGMLRMSNLVMWDEQTETWWQHITGEGIVGELAGTKLEALPAKIFSLGNYVKYFPDGVTLMPNDGPNYEKNNYVKYDSPDNTIPFLFSGKIDNRLLAMEYVIGVEKGDKQKVFPLSALRQAGVINSNIGEENIVLFYTPDMVSNLDTKDIKQGRKIGSGTVFRSLVDDMELSFISKGRVISDIETGSVWNFMGECVSGKMKGEKLTPVNYTLDFAFAYLAFYPEAVVYSD